MKVYTYSTARQRFASVLDEAKSSGEVQIRRKDGSLFKLVPVSAPKSPFSGIKGVHTGITRKDIVSVVRESRRGRT